MAETPFRLNYIEWEFTSKYGWATDIPPSFPSLHHKTTSLSPPLPIPCIQCWFKGERKAKTCLFYIAVDKGKKLKMKGFLHSLDFVVLVTCTYILLLPTLKNECFLLPPPPPPLSCCPREEGSDGVRPRLRVRLSQDWGCCCCCCCCCCGQRKLGFCCCCGILPSPPSSPPPWPLTGESWNKTFDIQFTHGWQGGGWGGCPSPNVQKPIPSPIAKNQGP